MSSSNLSSMKAEEAYKLIIENKKLLILDVRTKEEYEKGHIPGAKLIPVQALSARMDELYEYQDSPILVYCETGRRSSFAVNYLIENDFTEIYHLDRGIVAWKYDRALG